VCLFLFLPELIDSASNLNAKRRKKRKTGGRKLILSHKGKKIFQNQKAYHKTNWIKYGGQVEKTHLPLKIKQKKSRHGGRPLNFELKY